MDRPPHSRGPGIAKTNRRPLGETLRRALRGTLPLLLSCLLLLASGCAGVRDLASGRSLGGVSPPPSGSLSVSFIDVGQGDGVLVQAGGENYLIDAGRSEAGPEVVDFLRSRGVRDLDGMVATHPDADHIGGLPEVLDAFDVATVYLSGDTDKSTITYNTFLRRVQAEGSRVEEARAGKLMDWGGVDITVIAPPPDAGGGLFEDSNDNSVSLLLTYGTARILLAGDAEAKEEEYMANGPYTGPVTVLKVDHHGSNTSSTPLFLNAFRPKIAVIQVGENSYGHPTPETLARLREYGAKVFRNDEDGDIIVTIKDQKVDVAVTKP
ncbi:MAG TPA: ComEC/Rec2 family competence protein [Rubrobacteraceae bacterium]|nr:ComEC/Rec2 family competence protein [Rubrobacteraceae bacterium]